MNNLMFLVTMLVLLSGDLTQSPEEKSPNNILAIDDGLCIIEVGSHDELMMEIKQ